MKKIIAAAISAICLFITADAKTSGKNLVISPVLFRSQLNLSCLGLAVPNAVLEARRIRDLSCFENKIYIGHGNLDKNTGPTDVIYWDIDKACFTKEFTVDEESIENYEVLNDVLTIPGSDATEDWSFGNFYWYGTNGWVKNRTVPNALHVFSATSFQGRWYISTHALMEFPYGTNKKPGVGMILSSSDRGKTWRFEYASACEINTDVWYTAIIRYKERLYAFYQAFTFPNTQQFKQVHGSKPEVILNYTGLNDTVVYDGNNWRKASLIKEPSAYAIKPFKVGDYLGLSVEFCKPRSHWPPMPDRISLYRYDGLKTQLCQLPIQALQDVESVSNNTVLLLKMEGKWAVAETSDLQNIRIRFLPENIKHPTSIERAKGIIYIGTSHGLLYREKTRLEPTSQGSSEIAPSN
jgi:hypothetical protein